MSIKSYAIERWDAVLFGNSEYPTPIIYIKPDISLFEFAKDNKDALLVKIKSSKSIYDNKRITGVFASSSEIPNCRPVFFNNTNLYVIVLQAEWHGYPDCLGSCEIFGLKGGIPYKEVNNIILKKPQSINNIVEKYSDEKGCNLKISSIIGLFIGIFFILLISLFLIKK